MNMSFDNARSDELSDEDLSVVSGGNAVVVGWAIGKALDAATGDGLKNLVEKMIKDAGGAKKS